TTAAKSGWSSTTRSRDVGVGIADGRATRLQMEVAKVKLYTLSASQNQILGFTWRAQWGWVRRSAGRDLADQVLAVLAGHRGQEHAQGVEGLVGQGLQVGADGVDLVPFAVRFRGGGRPAEVFDRPEQEPRGQAEAAPEDVDLQAVALGGGGEERVQHAVEVGQAGQLPE